MDDNQQDKEAQEVKKRQLRFQKEIEQLNIDLNNGLKSIVTKHGQWVLNIGPKFTYNEVFGYGTTKAPKNDK